MRASPTPVAFAGAVGISFSAIFFTLSDVDPLTGAFYRMAYALPALALLWAWQRGRDTRTGRERALAMLAGVLLALDVVAWHAAIGMVGMDIETAVRNQIPILTIVWNNGAMAIETPTLPVATERFGAKYLGGDYAQLAKALGEYSERAEQPQEIVPAIQRAIRVTKEGRPALLEFITKEEPAFSTF